MYDTIIASKVKDQLASFMGNKTKGMESPREAGVAFTLPFLLVALSLPVPYKCAENIVAVFDRLYEELGPELFRRLFAVILTDCST